MRKKKFKDFFLKNFIIFTLIGAVVGTAIAGIEYIIINMVTELQCRFTVSEAKGKISNPEIGDAQRNWIISLYFDSNIDRETGLDSAALLIDSETNEIVASSAYNGYVIISKDKTDTGKPEFLMNKSEEYRKTLEEYAINGFGTQIDIKEIYVDGSEFYPGRVTISQYEDEDSLMDGTPVDSEDYDFTPENASEYKKIDYHRFEIAMGTLPDSQAMKDLLANPEGPSGFTQYAYCYDSIVTIDGRKYNFVSLYYLDYWGTFGLWILTTSIIYLVVLVGVELLVAFLQYRKYIRQYEIDEYRRNMTNALAHDLKSPLTAIYGYAENLKNNIHGEKKEYYADAVLENVQYMNEIITNTLELNKLELGDKNLKKEKVELSALCKDLYGKYLPQAESRKIKLEINGSAVVRADKKLLAQAVENLISNAVKYTSDSGKITVNILETAKQTTFEISNPSDGNITAQDLDKPFSKADSSRSNRSGSGMGLAIVKNIAMLHNFGFETKAENKTFTSKITFSKK